jgi:hypothetical protein
MDAHTEVEKIKKLWKQKFGTTRGRIGLAIQIAAERSGITKEQLILYRSNLARDRRSGRA